MSSSEADAGSRGRGGTVGLTGWQGVTERLTGQEVSYDDLHFLEGEHEHSHASIKLQKLV